MTDFIHRHELSQLREDIKENNSRLQTAIEGHFSRLSEEVKKTDERTQALSDGMNMLHLSQAVQAKQIEGLERNPQLELIQNAVELGFVGVNGRLDKVNGRLDKHTAEIAENRANIANLNLAIGSGQASGKMKAALVTGGGISILAVLHSLFEMVKAVGPQVLGWMFHR